MKTLQVVARDGTTLQVKVEETQPLLTQLVVPSGFVALHDAERLRPEDTFLSREMTDRDYIDLVQLSF